MVVGKARALNLFVKFFLQSTHEYSDQNMTTIFQLLIKRLHQTY